MTRMQSVQDKSEEVKSLVMWRVRSACAEYRGEKTAKSIKMQSAE